MMARISTNFAQCRLSPGTRLNGIYEIDHPIGIGGMGEIYKGHLIETGDPVAIKIMIPEFAENEDAFTLFRKEASALHHIQHDAVVRYYVFTVEPVLQRPYLAMEFVDGRTLTDILERDGPLSFEAVKALLRRIASGLQVAHEHGIIHRDISPDNIIVPYNDVGRAKVIDFGIARTTQHGTVISGGFAGKFSYVSPEQLGLFGGEITAKSDIYSLALVLAQALTGRPLDMSGSQVEVVEKRRTVPNLGAIDMRIRPLLEKMLQPDPVMRPEFYDDRFSLARRRGAGKSQVRCEALRHPKFRSYCQTAGLEKYGQRASASPWPLCCAAEALSFSFCQPTLIFSPSTLRREASLTLETKITNLSARDEARLRLTP